MSKRQGPTLTQNQRPRVGSKRQRESDAECIGKRVRFQTATSRFQTATSPNSRKRPASFDQEVEHLHKRMRATVPTAEETMAFLLPHLLNLRSLYTSAQNKALNAEHQCETMQVQCGVMETHLTTIQSAYHKLLAQNNTLKRQLELAKYRTILRDRENPNYI